MPDTGAGEKGKDYGLLETNAASVGADDDKKDSAQRAECGNTEERIVRSGRGKYREAGNNGAWNPADRLMIERLEKKDSTQCDACPRGATHHLQTDAVSGDVPALIV
jgi:hypothetical protein